MSASLIPSLQFFKRSRVPVQYQTEAAECGPACLAMLMSYHGNCVDLSSLRQRWPVSLKGVTLAQLIEMASEVEFLARPLRLDVQELSELRMPCILHWRLNHFVVLEKVGRKGVNIVDPATGRRQVDYAEVSRNFSGVALELAPTSGFTKSDEVHTLHLSRFFGDTQGVFGSLLQLLALSMALQVFLLLTPFYSQLVIDDIVVTGDIDLLRLAATSFIGLALFIAVSSAFRSWLIVYASSVLNLGWSSALFEHLVRLPYEYFEKRHVGDIQSRFGSLGAIRELITTQGVEAVIDGMMAVTTIAVMLLYSPALTSIVILSVVIYIIFRAATYRALKTASHEMIIRNAVVDSFFLETLRGILAIRNFGHETGRKTGYENRMTDSISATANVARINIWQDTANRLIFGVQNVVVVWVAAAMIIAGEFTAGMMVAFLAYKVQFANRAAALVDKFFQFKLVRIHLTRLEDIVDAPTEDQCAVPAVRCTTARRMSGEIELRNVSFRYGRNEPCVLTGLNLSIKPGEQVAIAGPSGSGKSTLLKIMVGLIRPTRGDVRIDGKMISDIGLHAYRRQIGVVMQNDRLLAGTMIDNIAFFSSGPDLAKVKNACRRAGVLDEILSMPMGLHTLVGDMGDVLSGGQKQRILLARALYREPVILFLDEATSHLDAGKEAALVREISELQMTRVVVAHRRETLRHADRLIRLSASRIGTAEPV